MFQVASGTDDLHDLDEDDTPDSDGVIDELFLWNFDAPTVKTKVPGAVLRTRNQFTETVKYDGVNASSPFSWYYRASVERPRPPRPGVEPALIQNNDIAGDNEVKVGTTNVTADLAASGIQDFGAGARITPASLKRPAEELSSDTPGTIVARGIGQGSDCNTCVLFTKEMPAPGNSGTITAVFQFHILTITPTTLTGKWHLAGKAYDPNIRFYRTPLGPYNVKVFIADRVFPSAGFTGPTINVVQ